MNSFGSSHLARRARNYDQTAIIFPKFQYNTIRKTILLYFPLEMKTKLIVVIVSWIIKLS